MHAASPLPPFVQPRSSSSGVTRPETPGSGETYLLAGEMHLNVGVHQVSVLSYEGLLDVSHDAGVHLGKALRAVDLHVILGPLPLGWDALWKQQVSARRHKPVGSLVNLTRL